MTSKYKVNDVVKFNYDFGVMCRNIRTMTGIIDCVEGGDDDNPEYEYSIYCESMDETFVVSETDILEKI